MSGVRDCTLVGSSSGLAPAPTNAAEAASSAPTLRCGATGTSHVLWACISISRPCSRLVTKHLSSALQSPDNVLRGRAELLLGCRGSGRGGGRVGVELERERPPSAK